MGGAGFPCQGRFRLNDRGLFPRATAAPSLKLAGNGRVPPSVAAVFRLAALLRLVAVLHFAAPLRLGAAFLLAAAFRLARAAFYPTRCDPIVHAWGQQMFARLCFHGQPVRASTTQVFVLIRIGLCAPWRAFSATASGGSR